MPLWLFTMKHSSSVSLLAFGSLCCWRCLFFGWEEKLISWLYSYLNAFLQKFGAQHPSGNFLPGVTLSFSVLPFCHKSSVVRDVVRGCILTTEGHVCQWQVRQSSVYMPWHFCHPFIIILINLQGTMATGCANSCQSRLRWKKSYAG